MTFTLTTELKLSLAMARRIADALENLGFQTTVEGHQVIIRYVEPTEIELLTKVISRVK